MNACSHQGLVDPSGPCPICACNAEEARRVAERIAAEDKLAALRQAQEAVKKAGKL